MWYQNKIAWEKDQTNLEQLICASNSIRAFDPDSWICFYGLTHWTHRVNMSVINNMISGTTLICVFTKTKQITSSATRRCGSKFESEIFKLTSGIWFFSNSCEIALERMSQDPADDKSTLVQVMSWCHQATSHYLSQCWPGSMSP